MWHVFLSGVLAFVLLVFQPVFVIVIGSSAKCIFLMFSFVLLLPFQTYLVSIFCVFFFLIFFFFRLSSVLITSYFLQPFFIFFIILNWEIIEAHIMTTVAYHWLKPKIFYIHIDTHYYSIFVLSYICYHEINIYTSKISVLRVSLIYLFLRSC